MVSATGVVTTLPGAAYAVVAAQDARIADITRRPGDSVKAGDVLVRFEFPSLRAQTLVSETAVKAAELRLQQAKLAQSRIRMLVEKGAASRSELDTADRELTVAEAEFLEAQAAFAATQSEGRGTLARAPFDGTVTERLHEPGDNVRADPSDPILRLIDPKQVQVTATVSTSDAARFAVGTSARAVAADKTTPELMRVSARPAPEGGAKTIEVTLSFEGPTSLPPGTQVGIEIDAEQRLNVPLVPAIAVLKDDPAGPVVVVAEGNTARRRPVVIGLVDAENIEILSGLKTGESIITQGHSLLRDGTAISVSAP
jgi:RND family efflux transporter MFP subunit